MASLETDKQGRHCDVVDSAAANDRHRLLHLDQHHSVRPNYVLIAITAFSVGLSLAYNRRGHLPIGDAAGYLFMAQGGNVKGIWPPFFPFLGSLALKLGFGSLRIVSHVTLVLFIIVVFQIAREFYADYTPALLPRVPFLALKS